MPKYIVVVETPGVAGGFSKAEGAFRGVRKNEMPAGIFNKVNKHWI
jgi:hypothetical protein